MKNGFLKRGTKQWKTVKTMKTVKIFETGGNSKNGEQRWTTVTKNENEKKRFWTREVQKEGGIKTLFC